MIQSVNSADYQPPEILRKTSVGSTFQQTATTTTANKSNSSSTNQRHEKPHQSTTATGMLNTNHASHNKNDGTTATPMLPAVDPQNPDFQGPTESNIFVGEAQEEGSSVPVYLIRNMILKVGLTVTLVIVWLFLAMNASILYLIGFITATGLAMIVQGYMRQKSVRLFQEAYILYHENNDNHHTHHHPIHSTRGRIIARYTDGFDPTVDAACGSCRPLCGGDDPSMAVVEYHKDSRQSYRRFDSLHEEEDQEEQVIRQQQISRKQPPPFSQEEAMAVAGSNHAIVVEYQAPIPRGWQRSDGYIIETDAVAAVVVKEFKQVHPDLYFDDSGHVEILVQTGQPKSGYPAAMLREFAPQHQNGRMVIGSIVVFMGLCMSIKSLMVELAQLEEGDESLAGLSIATWIAILANIILYAAVVFIVYTRSVLKHETLFTGQDARIVAWVLHGRDSVKKNFHFLHL